MGPNLILNSSVLQQLVADAIRINNEKIEAGEVTNNRRFSGANSAKDSHHRWPSKVGVG